MEKPKCASFEEYKDVPKIEPLDFMEDDVTWVTLKPSGSTGALGAGVIEF